MSRCADASFRAVWMGLALVALGVATRAHAAERPVNADWLLAGGTIVDGDGDAGYVGDVAIKDDRIVAVGQFEHGQIVTTLDCAGLVVAPGFIDLHSHSDRNVTDPSGRANVNFLMQGCTTIVTGNCGSGPVDVDTFFKKVEAGGCGTHVILLLGHGSLRRSVFGSVRRAPSDEELHKMKKLAHEAMRDGAWGMSTGLIYVPGTYAATDELVEIAKVVADHGGIYASHIRDEGTSLVDSVREAISIGEKARLPVHISHYKATGRSAWGGVRAAAELIEKARAEGQIVTADQYPYVASSTSLAAMLIPSWALEGSEADILARLNDEEQAEKIRVELHEKLEESIKIVVASYAAKPEWVGQSVLDIALSENSDPADIVFEIQRHGGASAVNFGMSEEDVRFAMRRPWVATASDGTAMIASAALPHPRSFGTFSRKIGQYALRDGVVTLEHAVRSASGLPADILSLDDRGYLKVGMVADIAIFDPDEFIDQATFDDPYQYSKGLSHVFVAGKPAVYRGQPTGALFGRALRHKSEK